MVTNESFRPGYVRTGVARGRIIYLGTIRGGNGDEVVPYTVPDMAQSVQGQTGAEASVKEMTLIQA